MSVYNYGDCDCCNVIIGYVDYTVILDDDVHLTVCEDCLPINE
mgnify:CR=1 FL=1